MIWNYFNQFKNSLLENNGDFKFLTDDIKVLLLSEQYTFDASHETTADLVSGDEISGAGYDAGGKTLAGKNRVGQSLFANDLLWSEITSDIRGALIYKVTGGSLMAHIDFEFTFSPAADDFKITWSSESGIFQLSTD